MASMNITPADLAAFWSAPWSVPFRAACRWLAPDAQTRVSPDAQPPAWLRPLCLQRWVGQAIAARLAWMRAHPAAALYRYSGSFDEGDPSIPYWADMATSSYTRLWLQHQEDDALLWRWNVEVERLLRVSEAPPCLVGENDWARSALGVALRLAQLYAELKRRHKARRARALLRDELRRYITWDYRAAA
jgi:hypothetical protein